MTQSLIERSGYHPFPDEISGKRGDRRVKERRDAILNIIDVHDKTLLDLGCSGGYFSFQLSKMARSVLAVDADSDMIKRNQELAQNHGYKNIVFHQAKISADFINTLPVFDITLFLSVFHHMLTVSAAYDWNQGNSTEEAFKTLNAIHKKTKCMVFEMGYPDENHEWCQRLPEMLPNPREWILKNIFGTNYATVKVIKSPAYSGITGYLRYIANYHKPNNLLIRRIIRKILALDPRDGRDIFIGIKDE